MNPTAIDKAGKVFCHVCGATMKCIATLKTKKQYKLRRYECVVYPEHQRSVISNDHQAINKWVREAIGAQERFFKQQERNQYEKRYEKAAGEDAG